MIPGSTTIPKAFVGIVLAVLTVGFLAWHAPAARAQEYSAGDEAELIQAINGVNAAGPGQHTITLTADITLAAPLPALANDQADLLTLNGTGHTLDGNQTGTVIVIRPGARVDITNLTITGGAGSSGVEVLAGSGGGIYNNGFLSITDSIIAGNAAVNGGGIANSGNEGVNATLSLLRTTVTNNEASSTGGGIHSLGNYGSATLMIEDSNISDNHAESYGGGIATGGFGGTAETNILTATLAGNTAEYGGGVFNQGNGGAAWLSVEASTLSGNSAVASGGAIFIGGNLGIATLLMTNSTVSGNTSLLGGGLGIANSEETGEATATIDFSTFADNAAKTGGSVYVTTKSHLTLAATILTAGSEGKACAAVNGGEIESAGYNLDSDGSCLLTQMTDTPDGAALLGPLALNAPGTTATHVIYPDSEAVDRVAANEAGCGASTIADQRGIARPQPGDGLCDIGAFERGPGDAIGYRLYQPVVIGQ